uniref:ShKT domain-containing protein n=1 Tax=Globodera rostochiensis TaxID=31243 RepID=A0A914HPJ0_GLORO
MKTFIFSLFPIIIIITVFAWYDTVVVPVTAEKDHRDISELLSDTADARQLNEIKRSNVMPKQSPPPRAIDIKRVPFTLPSAAENIRAVRRCQFSNGTLWPSATDCDDELGSGACETIFSANKVLRRTKESSRPLACLNKELADLARRCAKTCAFCCETPQFNCKDSGGTLIDCEKHKAKCKEPSWRRVMMSVCEHTCGLCAADACFDAADDCTSLRHLCFHHAVSPLVRQQCARSCGLCKPEDAARRSTASQEVLDVQKTPKEVIVLVRKNSQITSTVMPKSALCQDASSSCADSAGLCNDKIYADFLKDKCSKTCGHCKAENERESDDCSSGQQDNEDEDQQFEAVRHIRNRPSAANNASGIKVLPGGKREKLPKKSNDKFSDGLIIKFRGGGHNEEIVLRGQRGETLRISRELLLEDDEQSAFCDIGKSPAVNGKEETEKKKNGTGEIAQGQKRGRQLEKQKERKKKHKDREAKTVNELSTEKQSDEEEEEEEETRETEEEEEKSAGNYRGDERMRKDERQIEDMMVKVVDKTPTQRGRNRINREQRRFPAPRSLGRINHHSFSLEGRSSRMRSIPDEKVSDAKSLPDEKASDAKSLPDEKASDAISLPYEKAFGAKSLPDEKAFGAKSLPDEKAFDAKSIPDEKAFDAKSIPDEKASDAKSLPDEKASDAKSRSDEKASGAKSLPGENASGAKNLPDEKASVFRDESGSRGKNQLTDQNARAKNLTNGRAFSARSLPDERISENKNLADQRSSAAEAFPDQRISKTKNLPNRRASSSRSIADEKSLETKSADERLASRTKNPKEAPSDTKKLPEQKPSPGTVSGNSRLSQRILELLKNLKIARAAVTNYDTRRRRKRSSNSDQQNPTVPDQNRDHPKQNSTIAEQNFLERFPEEKPPDELKMEEAKLEKMVEEGQKMDEELLHGMIEEEDKLEHDEEELVEKIIEEKEKPNEESVDGIMEEEEKAHEKIVDELLEQLGGRYDAEYIVVKAMLEEIGAVSVDEPYNNSQRAQRLPKLKEELQESEEDVEEDDNDSGQVEEEYDEEEEDGNEDYEEVEEQILDDQWRPKVKVDDQDRAVPDQEGDTFPDDPVDEDDNNSLPDDKVRQFDTFAAAKSPKLTDFDRSEDDDWSKTADGRRIDRRNQMVHLRTNPDESRISVFNLNIMITYLIYCFLGGIRGALERVRLRYGFDNGTMEEMLANLLLDTERDIANGLKAILGELRTLKNSDGRKRTAELLRDDDDGRRGSTASGRKPMIGRDDDERGDDQSERATIRKSGGRRKKKSGNRRQYDQDNRTLRQLLNLLVDKKRAESVQNVVAKADNGGEDALPSLEELLELIKNQRKAMDKKTKSDKDGEEKKKPRPPPLASRRLRIVTARAASAIPRRTPSANVVLPRRVVLSSGGPISSGYRLVPIVGPGKQVSVPAQVYVTGQGTFLPPVNAGQQPAYPVPTTHFRPQEGQAVPAAQPQQIQIQQSPNQQQPAVAPPQQIVVQLPQQFQPQSQFVGQQQQLQPQQQPQTVYVQPQPSQQIQAVPATQPQQQPQLVVQRPAQQPLLSKPQQQQNLVVVDTPPGPGPSGLPRATVPFLQPSRVSRGSYAMLRNNVVGGFVGPAATPNCRDYHPYCEQIVPRGFCFSELYSLRTKREYCPQSCGLC